MATNYTPLKQRIYEVALGSGSTRTIMAGKYTAIGFFPDIQDVHLASAAIEKPVFGAMVVDQSEVSENSTGNVLIEKFVLQIKTAYITPDQIDEERKLSFDETILADKTELKNAFEYPANLEATESGTETGLIYLRHKRWTPRYNFKTGLVVCTFLFDGEIHLSR